jgi:thymidylate synthase
MENNNSLQEKYGWEYPYLSAMDACLETGDRRETRNGVTFAKFVREMRFNLKEGFPLLTTKKMNFNLIVAELLWFLEGGRKPNNRRGEIYGRMSLKRLEEIYGEPIKQMWVGDAENFKKRGKAKFEGDCGRIYGSQWRDWKKYNFIPAHAEIPPGEKYFMAPGPGSDCWRLDSCTIEHVDQIADLIKKLKSDYTGRYAKVTAWNPAEIDDMSLPACHCDFQCFVRKDKDGKYHLSLHMNQRSCDMFLGVPFNIASYALLAHVLAQVCGMEVDELIVTLNDYHVYEIHKEAVEEQLSRTPHELMPWLEINPEIKDIDGFNMSDFQIRNYNPQGRIKAEVLTEVVKK